MTNTNFDFETVAEGGTSKRFYHTGEQVQGSYFGVPYAGTVEQHRPHTMNAHEEVYLIKLSTPITVYGATRDSLSVTATVNTPEAGRGDE